MNEHLKRSRKQEKRGARLFNGTVNAGSGNRGRKNDVRADDWSIEFKTTTKASYSLKVADLQLAERQAILEHRKPLFGIDFDRGTGGTVRYVILCESDLLGVLRSIEALRLEVDHWRDEAARLERQQWSSNSE